MSRPALVLACAAALSGCGDTAAPPPPPAAVPIGTTRDHRPAPLSSATRHGRPVGRVFCSRTHPPRYGAHVEVFAARQVVIVPAGIGVAPPHRGRAPYVRSGRCSYPVRTREPTGVVEVARGAHATLGDLFDVWGQPL